MSFSKSGFNDDFVSQVKSANNIVSVISRVVKLDKKGNRHWGCCPFHLEKTPSFAINEQDQFYHCFGCGQWGDVIKFVQTYENVDFVRAIEMLAGYANIQMPVEVFDVNVAKKKRQKDIIYKINKDAALFYVSNLHKPQADEAVSYLFSRGLSNATITKFGIGASLDWNGLIEHLSKKGYNQDDMVLAGVADKKDGKVFDAFFKRIIFPIVDTFGQVVGFSGRTMQKDVTIAKYKNSKETEVFEKSKQIYGLNLVKSQKQKGELESIVLVEGQFDVIKLVEAGFDNVVASLGTAFGKWHARQLKRFCDKIIICFDGDKAGRAATIRAIDILEEEGLDVFVIDFPNDSDPDEFVSKNGKFEFEKVLKSAMSVPEYFIKKTKEKYDLTKKEQVSKYATEILQTLSNRKNKIELDVYLTTIAEQTGVHIDLLRSQAHNAEQKLEEKEKKPAKKSDVYNKSCLFVIASMIEKRPHANNVGQLEFEDKVFATFFDELKQGKAVGAILQNFEEDNEKVKELLNQKFDKFLEPEIEKKHFDDCIKNINVHYLEKQKEKLVEHYKKIKDEKLLLEIENITKQIKQTKGTDK